MLNLPISAAEKTSHIASRVAQTATTAVTAAATVPAAVISKLSTRIQNLPSKIVDKLLIPFRWLKDHIPFTKSKAEPVEEPNKAKYS